MQDKDKKESYMSRTSQKMILKTTKSKSKPVSKKIMTDDEQLRKASFLLKQFQNPAGKLVDENGRSTTLALSAAAWGEPVPKTSAAAHRLARKGEKMLQQLNHRKKIAESNKEEVKLKNELKSDHEPLS